jgi:lysophospholipase L1-like esterase
MQRRFLPWLTSALLLAACSSSQGSSSVSTLPMQDGLPAVSLSHGPFTSVVMVGDSITKASLPALGDMYTQVGITDQNIDAEVGRRIEVGNGKGSAPLSGIRTLYGLLAMKANPDVWVIELGTNDVGSYATPDDYGKLIDQVLAMLPKDDPLVWVNTYRQQYIDATKVFNLVLQDRLDARGHAAIADWYAVASAPDQTVLRSDHLHPNPNGQRALGLLVAQALQRL